MAKSPDLGRGFCKVFDPVANFDIVTQASWAVQCPRQRHGWVDA